MPSSEYTNQEARTTLFENCYYACRVIRDIVAYIDGDSSTLEPFDNPHIAPQVINLIKTGEYLAEARNWRRNFAETWEQLVDDDMVVLANEDPTRRSLAELVYIDDTTKRMIRRLEKRFIGIILQSRPLSAQQ